MASRGKNVGADIASMTMEYATNHGGIQQMMCYIRPTSGDTIIQHQMKFEWK